MSRTLKSIIIVILIFQNCCCYYYCFSFLLPFFLVITSSTCMLTSTTCKPVIYLTCSFTNSVTLRKILVLIHHILRLLLSRLSLVFANFYRNTSSYIVSTRECISKVIGRNRLSYLRYL